MTYNRKPTKKKKPEPLERLRKYIANATVVSIEVTALILLIHLLMQLISRQL